MIKKRDNSDHYNWGSHCSGWHLLRSGELSVIEEVMPPGTKEQIHMHHNSEQFFYILRGEAVFELQEGAYAVSEGEGFSIKPQTKHRIRNDRPDELVFLVVSHPCARADRVNMFEEEF